MEEQSVASSEMPVVKIVEEMVRNGEPIKEGEKKEEYDPSFSGEFLADNVCLANQKPSVSERSSNNFFSSRELLEAQYKVREIKPGLANLIQASKVSESENSKLNDEFLLMKEKLEKRQKLYNELELSNKKLQLQISEAEDRCNLHVNTLQEALQAEEKSQKDLTGVKESFDSAQIELQRAKKKMFEFEQELQLSAGEAQKFEELYKQIASIAELETKRALELEGLLEMAKASGKEVEDHMVTLQEELEGLYTKIAENEKVKDALKVSTTELCTVQRELELSKSQLVETENRLASKESFVNKLAQDLDMRKASEALVKEEYLAVEYLFSSAKENLQIKVSELEDIKLKLNEEVCAKALVEESRKNKESEVMMLKEELKKLNSQRESYEAALADLSSNATQMKELCSDLETLANSTELEERLRTLEELHHESDHAASTATKKNFELEEVLKAKNSAAEVVKSQMRELKTHFIASEQRILELEQHKDFMEVKCNDAERGVKECLERILELNALLRSVEEENIELTEQKQGYENKVTHLESELSSSSAKKLELESELKSATEKCGEHVGKAILTRQRGLELEDLVQSLHSKLEDAERKARQLELLLETGMHKIQELQGQINTLENKYGEAGENFTKHYNKVLELETEIKALQQKILGLERAQQLAAVKENDLTESLKITTEENIILGEALKDSTKKLVETENILDTLRNKLNLAQERLESIKCDLKASGMRETEVMEKLKFAEEQIEKHGSALKQATTRSLELELMHSIVEKYTELKLQEAIALFTSRDSEAKSLHDKVQALKDQVTIYKEQETESAQKFASLREGYNQIALKLASSESINKELNKKVSKAEDITAQYFIESEIQNKNYNEFQVLLDSVNAEKEFTSQQLLAHMNTITEFNEKHTKATEFQLVTETCISEAQTQLHDTLQKYTLRDTDGTELNEKLTVLEEQIKLCQEQFHEAFELSESHKTELDQAMTKLKALENKYGPLEIENKELAAENLKLTQVLSIYESRINYLQKKSSATSSQKVETLKQLHYSQTALTELKRQQISDGEKLQSQVNVCLQKLLTEIIEKHVPKHVPNDSLKKLEDIAKAEAGSNEENVGAIVKELKEGLAVKSRDIGSPASVLSEHKDNKMMVATSAETLSEDTQTQTSGDSSGMNVNWIMGVALVSAIVGGIFGKRY